MQRQESNNSNGFDFVVLIVSAIVMTAIVLLCGSCKHTEYVTVVEHQIDTMYVSQVQRDSIYLHDSTYIHEKGDTVFFERWHTKYIERQLHDTTYVASHDTVPVPYEVIKIKEEKYIPTLAKILSYFGGGILTMGIGVLLYFIIRLIIRKKVMFS